MYLDDERPKPARPRWMVLSMGAVALHSFVLGGVLLGVGQPLAHGTTAELRALGWMELALALGLLIAGRHPFRHWPVLLLAAFGELILPLLLWGEAPRWLRLLLAPGLPAAGLLGWIVCQAYRGSLRMAEEERRPTRGILEEARTQDGVSLLRLSEETPVLLVCLRHFGCVFCREALGRLARERMAIEACGARIALLHMSPEGEAEAFFATYGLEDLPRVSDPQRWVYFHLGLRKGGPWQLFGPKVWWRGFLVSVLRGHRLGRVAGDHRQMPGVFLIHHGEVLKAYLHRTAADNPDYRELATCPSE